MNTLTIPAAVLALSLLVAGCARQDQGRAAQDGRTAQQDAGCLLSTAPACVGMLRARHAPRDSDIAGELGQRTVPILEAPGVASARRLVIHLAAPDDRPTVWESFGEGNWIDRRRVILGFEAGQDTISSVELYFPDFAPLGLGDTPADYDRIHMWPLLNDVLPASCRFPSRSDGDRFVANLAFLAATGGGRGPRPYRVAEPSRLEAEAEHCGLTVRLVRWDVRGHSISGLISARWTTIRFSAPPGALEQRRAEGGQAGPAAGARPDSGAPAP